MFFHQMIVFSQSLNMKKRKIHSPKGVRKGQNKAVDRKSKGEKLNKKIIHKHFLDILSKKTLLTKVETCLATIHHSTIVINAIVPNI